VKGILYRLFDLATCASTVR